MPNVTPSPTDTTWLADAPEGANTPFDELFGTDPEKSLSSGSSETQTTTTSVDASQTGATPQDVRPPETTDQWEPIRARTGTVYNSREDAIKGTEEKDSLIAQLRSQIQEVTGQDPIKAARQQHTQPPQPVGYLNNPNKYAEDLAAAAKAGDAAKYMQIQLQLQEEYIAPYKPLLQELSRTTAQRKVKEQVSEFEGFLSSENYTKVLETAPALRGAIQAAESDLRYASQLDELYRLAYDSYVARVQLPTLVQAAHQQSATSTPAAPTRPTISNATLTPATPTTAATNDELMRSAQGRKELIDRFKAQGFDNMRF